MFTASRCNGLPLCALLVDIDHFKQINDTHGHATGDRVLQAVAQALKTTLREADLCGRLGGEEFGVLLTGTNLHEALQLAEKLRLAIQAIVVPMDNTALRVTISVGVAEAGAACADITTLLAQADAEPQLASQLDKRRAGYRLDDLLTLVYTSGTTGEPKGVMLDYANLQAVWQQHDERVSVGPEDVSLALLPLSHVYERFWSYYILYRGAKNVYLRRNQK